MPKDYINNQAIGTLIQTKPGKQLFLTLFLKGDDRKAREGAF